MNRSTKIGVVCTLALVILPWAAYAVNEFLFASWNDFSYADYIEVQGAWQMVSLFVWVFGGIAAAVFWIRWFLKRD